VEVESAGGKLHGLWYSIGGHDLYVLREVPAMYRWRPSVPRSRLMGAVQDLETIPLLTVEEMRSALATVGTIAYSRPPDRGAAGESK
jgi:hypothetical protein